MRWLLFALIASEVAAQAKSKPRVTDRALDIAARRGFRAPVRAGSPPYVPPIYSTFELAPLTGAGMPSAACDCANPTGATGEAINFGRASVAYCLKTTTSQTSIAAGDMVQCGSGRMRIATGGDSSGILGIGIWDAETNYLQLSQTFTSWTKINSGVGDPTVTGSFATGPDGLASATRIQLPAVGVAGYSSIYVTPGYSAGISQGAWIKGNATSGVSTLSLVSYAPIDCTASSYNATTWTLDRGQNKTTTSVGDLYLGLDNADCALGAQGAQDFLVWNVDQHIGAILGPPIKSLGTPTTRPAEVVSVDKAFAGQVRSFADTWVAPTGITDGATMLQLYLDASNDLRAEAQGGKLRCTFKIGGVSTTLDSAGSLVANAANRVSCSYDGTTLRTCLETVCATSVVALALPSTTSLFVGQRSGAVNFANGWHKAICVDVVSASRCI